MRGSYLGLLSCGTLPPKCHFGRLGVGCPFLSRQGNGQHLDIPFKLSAESANQPERNRVGCVVKAEARHLAFSEGVYERAGRAC
jgi:hypothetical protein